MTSIHVEDGRTQVRKRQKTMIVLPPDWNKEEPYYSLPCLTSVLRQNGIEVIQKDVNIEFYDYMLTKDGLNKILKQRMKEFSALEKRTSLSFIERRTYEATAKDVHFLPEMIREIEDAVTVIRTKDSMKDRKRYLAAYWLVATALQSIKRLMEDPIVDIERSDDVFRAATNPRSNLYDDYLREVFLPYLREEKPDVIGLSITAVRQVLPGFIMAGFIRREGLDAHVTVGGDIVTATRDVFQTQERWYDIVDSFIFFEGETPFLKLHDALERGSSLSEVPNCSYRSNGKVVVSPKGHIEHLDSLPTPDFFGLPWEKYLSSERFLCVTGGRGCHWGTVHILHSKLWYRCSGECSLPEHGQNCGRCA